MGKKCLIWTCKNKDDTPGITFHSLKRNRCASWLRAVGRSLQEDIFPSNVICSKHFLPEDFCYVGNKLELKDGVIPTQHLPKNAVFLNAVLREMTQSAEDPSEPPAKKIGIDVKQINRSKVENQPGSSIVMDLLTSRNDVEATFEIDEENDKFRNYGRIEIENDMEINQNDTEKQSVVYSSNDSVEEKSIEQLKEELKVVMERKKLLRNKTKVEKQRKKRISMRVSLLQKIVDTLKQKKMLSDDACALLEKTFLDLPVVTENKKQYSTLRSFAMTLYFFSSKAYEYTQRNFHLPLPSRRQIRMRFSSVSYNPGFSVSVFQSLKSKVRYNSSKGRATLCTLTLGEMPLKRQIEYFKGKAWGYINLNTSLKEDDTMQVATKALVLMVVSLNAQWKLPLGYFFIHSLTPDEKANVVKEALIKLHSCGIVVTSVTCDGPTANFGMMQGLGGQFDDVKGIVPYFSHPVDKTKVFIIFDPCRLVKNLGNAWKMLKKFVNPGGNEVDFEYLEILKSVLEEKGMKQKLKVNVDIEMLNEDAANALVTLKDKIRDPRFQQSSATIEFIRLLAIVSNYLSSKSPLTTCTKVPIEKNNEEKWKPIFQKAINYLINCRTMDKKILISTNHQTSFKGLIFTIFSVIGIYDTHIKPDDAKLQSLLTHELSQDHLEQFFDSIRLTNGCKSNPSAWQFRNAYKRLLSYDDMKLVNINDTTQNDKKT